MKEKVTSVPSQVTWKMVMVHKQMEDQEVAWGSRLFRLGFQVLLFGERDEGVKKSERSGLMRIEESTFKLLVMRPLWPLERPASRIKSRLLRGTKSTTVLLALRPLSVQQGLSWTVPKALSSSAVLQLNDDQLGCSITIIVKMFPTGSGAGNVANTREFRVRVRGKNKDKIKKWLENAENSIFY